MSAESREKAKEKGQKSGKGSEIISKAVERVTGNDEEERDEGS
jgi:hypothetical protein